MTYTNIVASNDLNESIVNSLKQEGAKINVWGIGTQLVTAYDQPALGGVYKLAALQQENGSWTYNLKLSEQLEKTSNPGIQQVRRYYDENGFVADMIFNEAEPLPEKILIVNPLDITQRKAIPAGTAYTDLLQPVLAKGELVQELPDLKTIRQRREREIGKLHESTKRILNPHSYPAGLEAGFQQAKTELVLAIREKGEAALK
jgi:nicotinate phosphoribosyltransferase